MQDTQENSQADYTQSVKDAVKEIVIHAASCVGEEDLDDDEFRFLSEMIELSLNYLKNKRGL